MREVSGLLVDQRHLRSSQTVRAIRTGVKIDHANPAIHQTSVLPRADMCAGLAAAREQPVAGPPTARVEPLGHRFPRRISDLARHASTGLLLNDCGALTIDAAMSDVGDTQLHEVAASKLRVAGDVEHRQVPNCSE